MRQSTKYLKNIVLGKTRLNSDAERRAMQRARTEKTMNQHDQHPNAKDSARCASATGYAATWILILQRGKEPVVKRTSGEQNHKDMMRECGSIYPAATVISLQTNPGDSGDLWAESSTNYWATANAA